MGGVGPGGGGELGFRSKHGRGGRVGWKIRAAGDVEVEPFAVALEAELEDLVAADGERAAAAGLQLREVEAGERGGHGRGDRGQPGVEHGEAGRVAGVGGLVLFGMSSRTVTPFEAPA